jgi:hypothetical protein
MPLTEINPIKAALQLMRQAKYDEAHEVLADAFEKNPNHAEVGRIANLISPCGMIPEAIDALQRFEGRIEEYHANKPVDDLSGEPPVEHLPVAQNGEAVAPSGELLENEYYHG